MMIVRLLQAALSLALVPVLAPAATAQDAVPHDSSATIRVTVMSDGSPLPDAIVRASDGSAEAARTTTSASGASTLRLPPGEHTIVAAKIGFAPDSLRVVLRPAQDTSVTLALTPDAVEIEELTVQSTRSGRRIDDQPLRVEVLGQEEVEEKLLMTPGDISMLLNESGGMRVQNTSSSLGGANVRIQGLRGRYSLLLSAGFRCTAARPGVSGCSRFRPWTSAR